MTLSRHRLTPGLVVAGIRSLVGFSKPESPLVHPSLYHQLIRAFFNKHRFGPPVGVTPPSTWPWVDHPASRLFLPTERPVQTRFRCGSLTLNLADKNN